MLARTSKGHKCNICKAFKSLTNFAYWRSTTCVARPLVGQILSKRIKVGEALQASNASEQSSPINPSDLGNVQDANLHQGSQPTQDCKARGSNFCNATQARQGEQSNLSKARTHSTW